MKKILIMLTVLSLVVMFTGCQQQKDVDLAAVWEKMEEDIEALPMIADLPEEAISEMYGINVEDLNEYIFKAAMINIRADEVIILELKDAKKADEVAAAIEEHNEKKLEQWSQYLPAQYELVKNAKFKVDGKYIYYIVAEESDAMVEIFESFLK